MAADMERIIRAVFGPLLDDNFSGSRTFRGNRALDTRSALLAIRAVLRPREWKRMQFIASSEDPVAQGLLRADAEDALSRMNPGFLFIVRRGIVRPIRRPLVLNGYSYMGRTYIALSERRLMTGQDDVMTAVELCNFNHLPKPNKITPFRETCDNTWNCSTELVRAYMDKAFRHGTHQEQVDIFQEEEFNFLHYDEQGTFDHAVPRAPDVPSVRLRKRCPDLEESDDSLEVP